METWSLIVPNIFGGASPDYWGPKSVTSGPHYLGALSLPFVLLALFKNRTRVMLAFFTAGTFGILFAWGEHFSLLNEFAFDYIPYFDKFRAPETWLTLTAFSYTVVAVFGLQWLTQFVSQKNKQLSELYLPLGISSAIVVLLFVQVNSMDFNRSGEVNNIANQIARQNQVNPNNPQVQRQAQSYVNTQLVPNREEKAKSDILRLAIFFIVGVGLIYLIYADKLPLSAGLMGFTLILAIDLINVDKRYIPENAIVAGNVNSERILESQRRDLDTFLEEQVSEGSEYPYRVFPLLDNPYSSADAAYFYPILGGYTGAKLSIVQDVMYGQGPLNIQTQNFNPQLLDLLNVKYLTYVEGLPLPGFEPVFNSEQGVVYENVDVFPKAFFVDSVITAQDPVTTFNYLMPGQLDLSQTAVIETSESIEAVSDSSASVQVTNYTGAEIEIELSRSEPGFLVLSEIYYPAGWTATLNGEEIPIYKTNYLLRGFEVPAGDHTLVLEFMPQSYKTGVLLSWISLIIQLLIAALWGFSWFKNRQNGGS